MSDYAPGTVAVATVRGVPNVRVVRGHKAWITTPAPKDHERFPATYSAIYDSAGEVTDVRPLVVLDLGAYPLVDVPHVLDDAANGQLPTPGNYDERRPVIFDIAQQIREQTKPPKPPKPAEPGKYGVVLAGDGREWFRWTTSERRGMDWCRPGAVGRTEYATWDALDVIRVVHEGARP